jgi:hypothetical protein
LKKIHGRDDAILEFYLEVTRIWRTTERASLENVDQLG